MSICDHVFNGYSRDLSLATRAVDEMDEYITDTCVRGFHVYQIVWRPVIGEELPCEREEENDTDRYAVAIMKPSVGVVGHVPRYMSRLCSLFIRHGGAIYSIVTGNRQYSRDLPQGGMHIPCKYRFVGSSEELKKISSYMNNSFVKNLLLLSSVSYDNEVFDEVKVKRSIKEVKKEFESIDSVTGTSKLDSKSNHTPMTIQSGRSLEYWQFPVTIE